MQLFISTELQTAQFAYAQFIQEDEATL